MKTVQALGCLAAIAVLASCASAQAQSRAQYEAMVAAEAQANLVPEELVHRVIVRESKYHPQLIGRGGTIGLMQIKLATARGVGYTGDAAGLRDPQTNLTYGVKYLAGAYHAANGDHARAVSYYAGGYYYVAKRHRQEIARQGDLNQGWLEPSGNPVLAFGGPPPKKLAQRVRNARAQVPH